MSFFQKLSYLLSATQKKRLVVLTGLLIIGVFLEMAGLGIIIPSLGIILNPNIGAKYPIFQSFLKFIGNPTRIQLILLGMSCMVLVYLIKAFFSVFVSWRQSKFSGDFLAELSHELFLGYLSQPYTLHLQRNSSELLRNIQSEVAQFNNVAQAAINLTTELSVIIGVALLLIIIEPLGALSIIMFLTITAYVFHRATKNKLVRWGQSRQYHAMHINQHLMQGLAGVKDVKLMGRESYFLEEYSNHNNEYTKTKIKADTLALVPRPYLELMSVIGLIGLIVLMIIQGKPLELLLPTLGVFVAAAFRMLPSVNRIMAAMQVIRFARPVVDVLYNEFKDIRDFRETVTYKTAVNFTDEIKIENLYFAYPGTTFMAINNISMSIKKGESIGLIGTSGSGKSTLVDVILGLLTPTSGIVKADNQDIQNNLRGWQDQIGYVPQSIYLTDDTLRRNVAFGIPHSQIDDNAVENAIKAAQLNEFVDSLPDKLETLVGERGVRLSGGQRQRIGIARALYHDPQVLVLDEATSALDLATEDGVMQAVTALRRDKTLIIIAHRLSTVENCDRLYRLDQGYIVEEGSPSDILKAQQIS